MDNITMAEIAEAALECARRDEARKAAKRTFCTEYVEALKNAPLKQRPDLMEPETWAETHARKVTGGLYRERIRAAHLAGAARRRLNALCRKALREQSNG